MHLRPFILLGICILCGPVEAGSVGVTVKDSKVNVRDVNCPNSELPSSNLDQFFVSPLGGAKKRLGASDLTRGLHGHSCLRVRVGTMELAKWDKSPTKLQQCERARHNCPNSELPSSNLDQFFVSPLGGAKKRLGASDLTRGLHGHSCLRVRVGTLELAKWDKSPTKLQPCERAGHNCPNSELPSSNLDQFFVSPLGGAKK